MDEGSDLVIADNIPVQYYLKDWLMLRASISSLFNQYFSIWIGLVNNNTQENSNSKEFYWLNEKLNMMNDYWAAGQPVLALVHYGLPYIQEIFLLEN
jgi:hypothetical protein